MVKGSCLCGTVSYEVSGPLNAMMSCHCSMCRKHHGSAFATYVSAPIDRFRWVSGEDSILSYESSAQGVRTSCAVCGSAVPLTMVSVGLALLPAGPLEGELGLSPQAHMFVASKAPWYTITDELPRHDEYPPEYATPGLQRPTVQAREGVTAGSCLCGAIAFEVDDPPMLMQSCHCQRCRRARGAAHGTNIFYKASRFRWIRGEELLSDYKLPEAKFYSTSFCSRCGSHLPRVSRERDIAVIPAGCLDTDPPMRPQRHIFTGSKASWFAITDSLPQFVEGPPPPASSAGMRT
ncbi:MAG: GFA family protein [Gammaproteobacteria bacterium]